jgi:hypothetical protein
MDVLVMLIPLLALFFSFLGVSVWAKERRKEREAYYRSEVLKKIADSTSEGAAYALEYLREKEQSGGRRVRAALRLAGVVLLFAGMALYVFLRRMLPFEPVYLVGLFPVSVGAALLVYSLFLAPRQ